MATFSCNLRCEKYCSSKCKIDPYWESKIKDGRPKLWDLSSEKTKEWSTSEREALEKILTRLPDDFKKISLDGIYRMGKSVQIVNPGTTYEASITLYDYAFQDPPFTLERVIVHELAHVIFNKLTKRYFKFSF
ncbi:MAG: hypothetical protein ACK41T_10275 [Pseudobdellovibrio sp.]